MKKMIMRLNKGCAYFPCHKQIEDCTFCYCPFYPCKNLKLGKYIFRKDKSRVWSCMNCSWIHKKKVVDKIFNFLKESNSRQKAMGLFAEDKGGSDPSCGIIILGHGSNLKQANNTIIRAIREIEKRRWPGIIEPAYLQLCKPNLHTAVKKIIERGCNKIVIVPFFLFRGNHVSKDIPRHIEEEARAYKHVEFVYAKNLGHDPRINDIVWDCIKEAL